MTELEIMAIKTYSQGKLRRRMEMTEDRISKLEDPSIPFTQFEQQIDNRLKNNEGSLSHLWNNNKICNICIFRVQEGGEKESKAKEH